MAKILLLFNIIFNYQYDKEFRVKDFIIFNFIKIIKIFVFVINMIKNLE